MLYLYSSQHLMAPGSSSWPHGDILQDQTCWAGSSSSAGLWRHPRALAHLPRTPQPQEWSHKLLGVLTKPESLVTWGVCKPSSILRARRVASTGSPGVLWVTRQ